MGFLSEGVSLPLGGRWLAEGQTDEGQPCGVVLRLVSFSFCYVKGRGRRFKNRFFFPAGKRNGFWNPKKKGLPCGLSGPK